MSRRAEEAALILGPHFDCVRDVFAAFEVEPGHKLFRLKQVKLVVSNWVHDKPRHFGACSEDGREIHLAPEAANLDLENLTAILSHEFGHAADFSYPAMWVTDRKKPAIWIGDDKSKQARAWGRLWSDRSPDMVEWGADSIAERVLGKPICYCGPDLVQCFSGAVRRPAALR